MQKIYIIKETINKYHTITINEELNVENIVENVENLVKRYDSCVEAFDNILEIYKDKYGFDYEIKPEECGTEVLGIEIVEEM